jgi:head-tail adaptor
MFNSGLAKTQVTFERPVEATDTNGAPVRTWLPIRTCWCQVENEQVTASENIQAPYEQATRQFTLIARTSPSQELLTKDRARTSSGAWLGAITGIRYSALKDVMYIDIETGLSAG